ncbi:hypothetical protein DH2020_043632 [Rehmannia glutinosa]|uniref:SBP-type domain-containing protein n=1 Tax=Rehmannia glutinosa TaxID=99300 RepID=A0ABR0UJ40_REHGL
MQQNPPPSIPTPASLPRIPDIPSAALTPHDDPSSSSPFTWSDFLDFNLDESLNISFHQPESEPDQPGLDQSQPSEIHGEEKPGRIRKRDPRLTCSNFLAGRIPCACPELDAMLEEEESGLPGKKRTRTVRNSGGAPTRCQVPGCEVDISELKGYHKRHRVCLQCANASAVALDGESKRYCQQCGKFHILSDFDEGKRSCRRKLERHNIRRRRKPNGSKEGTEKEAQESILADDVSGDDDIGKDGICVSSQIEEREILLESDGHVSTLSSVLGSQNLQSDSVVSFAASGETHIEGDKQNPKYKHFPSYGDKSDFCSVIFQWLASMPVELEGYIRPGCTILTAFIAMPKPVWLKLLEEPALCIRDLVASPGSMLSGRGTMHVYLDDMVFFVRKDATSVVKVKVKDRAPKLHYIYPTCFEAGRPMEFVACGSYLLQSNFRYDMMLHLGLLKACSRRWPQRLGNPKAGDVSKGSALVCLLPRHGRTKAAPLRHCLLPINILLPMQVDEANLDGIHGTVNLVWFLISFAGRYLAYNIRVSSPCFEKGDANRADHQLLKIYVPQIDMALFGPAFIEVENQSGLSNFIPILVGDKETCVEMEILQQKFDTRLSTREQNPSPSCEVFALRQAQFSEFLLDVAWLLKKPVSDQKLTSSHIQRFKYLLDFLIEKESFVVLERVFCSLRSAMENNSVDGISDSDMRLLQKNMDMAERRLAQKVLEKEFPGIPAPNDANFCSHSCQNENVFVVPAANQGIQRTVKNMLGLIVTSPSLHDDATVPLLKEEVIMNVNIPERPRKSCSRLLTRTILTSRLLIVAIMAVGVCFGVCAVVLHPQRISQIATTIQRSRSRKDRIWGGAFSYDFLLAFPPPRAQKPELVWNLLFKASFSLEEILLDRLRLPDRLLLLSFALVVSAARSD